MLAQFSPVYNFFAFSKLSVFLSCTILRLKVARYYPPLQ